MLSNGLESIDNEWEMFMENGFCEEAVEKKRVIKQIPKCSGLYVSTKTKIVYLDKSIDLNDLFWKLEIIPYSLYKDGIIKKQMKINSKCIQEVEDIEKRLEKYDYSKSFVINSISNPSGRVKFKDIRKISVGLCKKDFINQRKAEKGAFYNCFVIILRVKVEDVYNEYHVKVFNTGKLELPGIKQDDELEILLNKLLEILNMYLKNKVSLTDKTDTVLINSNFECGYFLDRDKLFKILKSKYNIQSVYDPCSYPGIQCKLFFDNLDNISHESVNSEDNSEESGGKVSFMIFRTGSVLIVGKCNMVILNKMYDNIKSILENEYEEIYEMEKEVSSKQITKKKIKHKIMFKA